MRVGVRGGLCIRAMDMAVSGARVVEKKIVKKAGPRDGGVWVRVCKKSLLIDTIDSEASRLRRYHADWSVAIVSNFFTEASNEAVDV